MWNNPFIVPIAIVFIVVGLPVLCNMILKLARILRGVPEEPENEKDSKKKNKAQSADLQEMNRILNKLEERIDSLETIVLEQNRRKTTNEKSL